MFSPVLVLSVICIYSAILFIIALWVEKSPDLGKKLSNSPLIYALSLGIYCTAWTYYGSVGKAASSGLLFLTIYLGPTLAIIFWWTILRKLVRIKNTYRITSIADFISARYNNSHALAAIATLVALLGGIPYISLQLKAVFSTFQLITCYKTGSCSVLSELFVRIIVLGIMIIFTILMGVRRLDPTERHPGMMVALAVECVVKCLAFIAAGIFVTYFIFHGFKDIFKQISLNPQILNPPSGGTEKVSYMTWASYLLLSMSAIMFLPRQFHVAVVENPKEKNIITAMWFFPIYMILLNIFVYPIALGGLLKSYSIQQADTFVLLMPLENAKPWLTLFVFLGGFSAAIGMIMIATMTIATMVTNHFFLPLTQGIKNFNFLRRHLLKCRWLVVGACVLLGYWFEIKIGESYMLVNIGMISFAAVFQFAPSMVGGLFWKKGNRRGAILGLTSGFFIWVYTLLIPSFVRRGWLPAALLENGPFHLKFLNPEHLFGVTNLDYLSHAVFWSLLFNAGLYILGSLYFKQEEEEKKIAENFIDILKTGPAVVHYGEQTAQIDVNEKKEIVTDLLTQYFPEQEALYLAEKLFSDAGNMNDGKISVVELAELNSKVEKFLTGSIGAAAAHRALKQAGIFSVPEAKELQDTYAKILANLNVSPEELKAKIDYYQERAQLITRHAAELEDKIRELQKNIQQRKDAEEALALQTKELLRSNSELERFAYVASHDLQEPLRTVKSYIQLLENRYKDKLDPQATEFIAYAVDGVSWMQSLINGLLTYSRVGTEAKEFETVDSNTIIKRVLRNLQVIIRENNAAVTFASLPTIKVDSAQIELLFQNLISNAIKFHADQPPQVHISTEEKLKEWVFCVRDNGIGIPEQSAERIFEMFQRLHTRKKYPGTGIGLAVCKKIVERHGGRIWVESEMGEGAKFYFTIPK